MLQEKQLPFLVREGPLGVEMFLVWVDYMLN